MSEWWEFEQEAAEEEYKERLLEELGPQWAEENGFAPYEDAIRDFTVERLQSYYLANPKVAQPAFDSLVYAQSLMPTHPRAALIFAVTATELSVKSILLRPIVYGLVHTMGLASFITDLAIQHTGMERFQALLSEILKQFGGVDFKTYTRSGSATTLQQEISEIQKARNAVVHRGENVEARTAELAISVASTLLTEIFPQVVGKLSLHLHDGFFVCCENHQPTLFSGLCSD